MAKASDNKDTGQCWFIYGAVDTPIRCGGEVVAKGMCLFHLMDLDDADTKAAQKRTKRIPIIGKAMRKLYGWTKWKKA